jgi:chromosome segregation ATPase
MGGKKKKGKKKEKAMDVDPDDPLMQYDSQRLLTTQQDLLDKLSTAKVRRNMLQMEKDMIHDFYHNTRSEIKELEARIKNLDTDMQTLEEKHKTQIKVYQQKVKHLEYEHGNNKDQVINEANKLMNEEKGYHTDKEKDMIKDKKKYKDEYIRDQISNATQIENEEKDFDLEIQELKRQLDEERINLIETYERKMVALNDELDLRMKVEIHEIEERKNQHINELLKNHEEAFREMKDYYNDITRENLELIRMYKEKLDDIRE